MPGIIAFHPHVIDNRIKRSSQGMSGQYEDLIPTPFLIARGGTEFDLPHIPWWRVPAFTGKARRPAADVEQILAAGRPPVTPGRAAPTASRSGSTRSQASSMAAAAVGERSARLPADVRPGALAPGDVAGAAVVAVCRPAFIVFFGLTTG
ncbi:hypothetical protein FRZ03_33705 [Streptomyces misionensis]|uniref:Uncharacterized protein n=1 Tax=Streptomyces misionensis TaxID=67331 RepID=A0A5C6IUM3_9ACTN|nr:hypothetical protein [Streptomyces misionensis]TWV32037.1 hypothetical protein FRZ03_33705 [Streptomyces misionensis]